MRSLWPQVLSLGSAVSSQSSKYWAGTKNCVLCAAWNALLEYGALPSFDGAPASALEKAMAPPLQYSCLENPMDGEAW